LAATTLSVNYNGLSDAAALDIPGGIKTQAGVCIVPFLSSAQPIICASSALVALTAIPGSATCGCSSNDGVVTIGALRSSAICLLANYGNTVTTNPQRTYEECVKDLLDVVVNNGNPSGSSAYPCGPAAGALDHPGHLGSRRRQDHLHVHRDGRRWPPGRRRRDGRRACGHPGG